MQLGWVKTGTGIQPLTLTLPEKLPHLPRFLAQRASGLDNIVQPAAVPAPIEQNETGGQEENDSDKGQHESAAPPAHERQCRAVERKYDGCNDGQGPGDIRRHSSAHRPPTPSQDDESAIWHQAG